MGVGEFGVPEVVAKCNPRKRITARKHAMPDEKAMTIAEDFGKYVESFAVIQTGSVDNDGEITKYPSPVVIGVFATREKANSQKKHQATRIARIHKWFASDDAIDTPLLAVRIVMIRKPVKRKAKATSTEDKPLTPDYTVIPADVRADEFAKAPENNFGKPTEKKRK